MEEILWCFIHAEKWQNWSERFHHEDDSARLMKNVYIVSLNASGYEDHLHLNLICFHNRKSAEDWVAKWDSEVTETHHLEWSRREDHWKVLSGLMEVDLSWLFDGVSLEIEEIPIKES